MSEAVAPAKDEVLRTDVLIIGAGPVGLFAAFEAGVIGLSCHIVDALEQVGGQCIELYPDKPIFDIPAVPVCTARQLIDRLMEQCKPFAPQIHLGERVMRVERIEEAHRWKVTTDRGLVFDTAAVLLSAGNGAFVPQRVGLPEAQALEGRSVHYAVRQRAMFADRRIVVAGGGDSALDWALALRDQAKRVTLVHRRNAFRAADATVQEMQRAVAAGQMDLVIGTIATLNAADGALQSIDIKTLGGDTTIEADHLVALYGLVADLGPIAGWGLDVRAGRVAVDTSYYETSVPGIFGVGDIATYPNKQKLILSGFHEASLALRKAYGYAFPDKKRVHVHSSYDAALSERILGTSVT
ncbi:NAD(P)/FAD-dependent oxidoreductase [Trinickia dinghuensis]|uniref:Ferredoxin--NADP reductase n=1 Tax=Trinickia dinghuensis TaxID=2291023 RepID=A0A3D8JPQ5_9BURK|nr:NAD(P)/FAD-dependent oxidoreductase [Trinickia dinghuensis]RDU94696.1 NAD(P)/FAD-dependent oxidoreductase [Trinickia dinghuensis]